MRPGPKYGNRKTVVDGITFASAREARRWGELQLMQRAGYITDLERQVRFPMAVNGKTVCAYVADFQYQRAGKRVVEDAKGFRTPEYKLKAKLMAAVHDIQIEEV
jgi:hypothetical protein